jgi:hypothetical protein
MTLQELWNYLYEIKLLEDALPEFALMDETDLQLVLGTILPHGINTSNLIEEIKEWQVINQDTMKR